MNADQSLVDEIVADLMQLAQEWETAADHSERAAAVAYRRAAADLRTYVTGDLPGTQPAAPAFRMIPTIDVERMLAEAGQRPLRLFTDKDHTFSAIFARLPAVPLEERVRQFEAIPGLRVIESGTLMETREPFIDFGFPTPGSGNQEHHE